MKRYVHVAVLAMVAVAPLIAQAPKGWKMRVDRSTSASDPDAPGEIKFVTMGAGFHATNPQAAVYWNPANAAKGAYTVDGEALGEINHETWSARQATVTLTGVASPVTLVADMDFTGLGEVVFDGGMRVACVRCAFDAIRLRDAASGAPELWLLDSLVDADDGDPTSQPPGGGAKAGRACSCATC